MKVCLSCGERFDLPSWQCPSCAHLPASLQGFPAFAPEAAYSNDGFRSEYFGSLSATEETSFWFGARNKLLVWALSVFFPRAESLLEVGCGDGFVLGALSRALPQIRLSGCEIFCDGLKIARERAGTAQLLQADARHLPFDSEFDVVGAFDVLEHIQDDEEVLRQLRRACKPGGGIIVTVPQHPTLWSAVDDYAFHKRRYTRAELSQKVKRNGFSVLRMTSFVSLLLPLMIVSRLTKSNDVARLNPAAELRLPPALNGLLAGVMAVERAVIKAALSLPAGGSLLLVAQRR